MNPNPNEEEENLRVDISPNEIRAALKNKLLTNIYLNNVKRFRQESKVNCFNIMNKKAQVNNSIPNIKRSTGYAFRRSTYLLWSL